MYKVMVLSKNGCDVYYSETKKDGKALYRLKELLINDDEYISVKLIDTKNSKILFHSFKKHVL